LAGASGSYELLRCQGNTETLDLLPSKPWSVVIAWDIHCPGDSTHVRPFGCASIRDREGPGADPGRSRRVDRGNQGPGGSSRKEDVSPRFLDWFAASRRHILRAMGQGGPSSWLGQS